MWRLSHIGGRQATQAGAPPDSAIRRRDPKWSSDRYFRIRGCGMSRVNGPCTLLRFSRFCPPSRGRHPLSLEAPGPSRDAGRAGEASIAAPRPRWSTPRPTVYGARGARQKSADRVRRALNVGVAFSALILASPLMALVALAVKTTSSGPIFHRQPHVGLDRRRSRGEELARRRRCLDWGGRVFNAYSFRVTRWSLSGKGAQPFRGDAPLTPVGSILRACRLEGLPLLFNVLRGDMNIVGPRPERPEPFRDLREELGAGYSRYAERQTVLPGITGFAQVSRAWDGHPAQRDGVGSELELDVEYVRSRTATRDLSIMASVIPLMFLRRIRE